MELYLMQHGTALSKELDEDRPLSPVGRDQLVKSAEAVKKLGIGLDLIVASPATRSLQTAQIVAAQVGYPESAILQVNAVKPMARPEEVVEFLHEHEDKGSVLIAGHLPSLEKIAALLISHRGEAALAFQNGGLTCIEIEEFTRPIAKLLWHLTPLHLQIIANS